MKQSWINIRHVYGPVNQAKGLIKVLEKKFPSIKFKHGPMTCKQTPYGWEAIVAVKALLPTPHPNDTAREVVDYATSLELKYEWVPWTP